MSLIRGSKTHVFSRKRPSKTGASRISQRPPQGANSFRPLPDPTGPTPFRLDLKDVIAPDIYEHVVQSRELIFHLNGDMGGIKYAVPQELVAKGMEADFPETGSSDLAPAFLYITGDCVYFNGEVSDYYTQFYEPYEFYPAPIFAVPGNHDGDNVAGDNSLNGFVRNFCAPKAVQMPEAQDSTRTAMTQPNVYWTLLTPLVNIIGLYSNVPEGGDIRSPQTDWLINELTTLPKDVPIFLALHHPIFSADDHHSGSVRMQEIIEDAIQRSGRSPEAILAGHVHDYQRLTQDREDGTKILYLVTGAGGYHNLHSIQKVDGEKMIAPVTFSDHNRNVTLEKYSDDHHGFLRVELTGPLMTGRYFQVPRPQDAWSKPSQLIDYFEFDLAKRAYQSNKL